MLAVFLRFLIPFGGGIPAGVLQAKAQGLAWSLTGLLYLISDLVLVLLFEPLLRGLLALGRRSDRMSRVGTALQEATTRSLEPYRGTSSALGLTLIAFGVDPMTGRGAALAAGYGPMSGWTFALLGDLLYFAVVAAATLRLSATFGNPEAAVATMLALMVVGPVLVRRLRA